MEDGILKGSLWFLDKVVPEDRSFSIFSAKPMYKHYILFFQARNECFVLDTKKKVFIKSVIEGTGLENRRDFSVVYWKDNLFVLFGGKFRTPNSADEKPALGVHLIEVNDDECERYFSLQTKYFSDQISFKIKHFNDVPKGSISHPVHIYRDSMFIFEGFGSVNPNAFQVWKFDLSTNQWSICETQGEAPQPRYGFVSALFDSKFYILGGFFKTSGGFFASQPVKDVFTFDPDNMQWNKVLEDGIPPLHAAGGSTAWTIGKKIYIHHDAMKEFMIFDPANNTLQYSQDVPPEKGWHIRPFKDRSTLFRFLGSGLRSPLFEFQVFETPTVQNQTSPPIQEELPGTQMIQTKKNILSEAHHMNVLWKEKPFADVTFVVENEEIQAHKIILLKCQYFEDMFNNKKKVNEESSDKINITDISSTNFKAILEYIYLGKITLSEQLALDLIILAVKYCMFDLEAVCDDYLSNHLGSENLLKIIKINETADSGKIEDAIVRYLVSNIEKLQQEVDIHDIPHNILVQAMIRMKEQVFPQQKPPSFFK